MIFWLKQRWLRAVVAAGILTGVAVALGGWTDLLGDRHPVGWQVLLGVAGGCGALALDGVLHLLFGLLGGERYRRASDEYGREMLGDMGPAEWFTGGAMAGVAEEPFFRGVILRAFDGAATGVAISSVAFAVAHWRRWKRWPFVLWAAWEGVWFGLLYVITGSVLVPMIAHGLHDLVAYAVLARMVRNQRPG